MRPLSLFAPADVALLLGLATVSLFAGCGSSSSSSVGAARPAAPPSYVRFSNGRLELPHNNIMNTGRAVTIEGWVRAGQDARGPLFVFTRFRDIRPNSEHKLLYVQRDGSIGALYNGSPWHPDGLRTAEGTFAFDGQWHHVAFVRTDTGSSPSQDQWAITYDGVVKRWGRGPDWPVSSLIQSGNNPTIIGEDYYTPGGTSGYDLRSVRVSGVTRYVPMGDFFEGQTLFMPSTAWASDSSTALLLDMTTASGTQVVDRSPAGQVATLSPNAGASGHGVAWFGPSPQGGWALRCNTDGTITFPNESLLNTGAEVTIEGWVQASGAASGTFPMFSRMNSATEGKQVSILEDGSIRVLYSGSPGQFVTTQPGIFRKDADWHHVAFVRRLATATSPADWSVYYDGSLVLRGSLDTLAGPAGMLLQASNSLWRYDGANWVQAAATSLAGATPLSMSNVNIDDVLLLNANYTPASGPQRLDPYSLVGTNWVNAPFSSAVVLPVRSNLPVASNGIDKLLLAYGQDFVLTRNDFYQLQRNSAVSTTASLLGTYVNGASMPQPRSEHALAFDKRRKLFLLFGGKSASGVYLNDTWTFDGATWMPHYSADPNLSGFTTGPSPRGMAAMAYHDLAEHFVLHGGTTDLLAGAMADTWIFHNGWQPISPAAGNGPQARVKAAMAYDGDRQVVVLHGGREGFFVGRNDTWEWSGAAWRQVVTTSAPPVSTGNAYPMAWRRPACSNGGCDIASQTGNTQIGAIGTSGYSIAGLRVTARPLYQGSFAPPTRLDVLPSDPTAANGSVFVLRTTPGSTQVTNAVTTRTGTASVQVTGGSATNWAPSADEVGR